MPKTTATEDGPHPVDLHVGARIRLRRRALGISQEKLAEKLGLTFQQVQKYERGANRVSASKLADIAKALSCQPGWFFIDRPGEDEDAETLEVDIASGRDLDAIPGGPELARLFSRALTPNARKALMACAQALAGATPEHELTVGLVEITAPGDTFRSYAKVYDPREDAEFNARVTAIAEASVGRAAAKIARGHAVR